jgi:hypothetical protein
MRWYGGKGGQEFPVELHLGGDEVLVANSVIYPLEVLALLEPPPDGEAVVELVAGELDLLAVIVVLEEADEVTGREAGGGKGLSLRSLFTLK